MRLSPVVPPRGRRVGASMKRVPCGGTPALLRVKALAETDRDSWVSSGLQAHLLPAGLQHRLLPPVPNLNAIARGILDKPTPPAVPTSSISRVRALSPAGRLLHQGAPVPPNSPQVQLAPALESCWSPVGLGAKPLTHSALWPGARLCLVRFVLWSNAAPCPGGD